MPRVPKRERAVFSITHHLVILREIYLNAMRAGRKRVECRLLSIRKPPFENVAEGGLLWFMVPSGPVYTFAHAEKWARFGRLI